ncbi:hypothetical protein Q1695_011584 [Nippostrongylus brasiliensis]|nr:hypothetical protein Q1695_011584 [Nippostrongylus brasiliensis]
MGRKEPSPSPPRQMFWVSCLVSVGHCIIGVSVVTRSNNSKRHTSALTVTSPLTHSSPGQVEHQSSPGCRSTTRTRRLEFGKGIQETLDVHRSLLSLLTEFRNRIVDVKQLLLLASEKSCDIAGPTEKILFCLQSQIRPTEENCEGS